MPKTYVGFVIDMSQSMSKNWKILDWKAEASKMKSVKNAFNYIFGRGSDTRTMLEQKKVRFFALGMGIKHKESLVSVSDSDSEKSLDDKESESTRVDRIIDIFSFTKLVPSKEFTELLKNEVEAHLEQVADKLLDEYVSKYRLDQEIDSEELEGILYDSIDTQARNSWFFRLHEAILSSDRSMNYYIGILLNSIGLVKLKDWEGVVDRVTQNEIDRYLNRVVGHAERVFHKRKKQYKDHIHEQLEVFLDESLNQTLVNNAIGFSFENTVESFDIAHAKKLMEEIYRYLLKDMKKSIGISHSAIEMYILPRITQLKLGYFNAIDIRAANKISLHLMRKVVFDEVQSFVGQTAEKLFEDTFTKSLKKQIHNWIYFAERSEVTLRADQIPTFFPNTEDEEQVYNKKFMFGSTPIEKALKMASMRLMRLGEEDQKILVILSDGDFKKSFRHVSNTISILKEESVLIICLYVTDLKSKVYDKGFKNMQKLTSRVEDIGWDSRGKANVPKDRDLLFKVDSEESITSALKELFEIAL